MNPFPLCALFLVSRRDREQNNSCPIKGVPTVPSVPTPTHICENSSIGACAQIPRVILAPHWELGTGNNRIPANEAQSKQSKQGN